MLFIFCDNSLNLFLNFRGSIAEHFNRLGYDTALVIPSYGCTEEQLRKAPSYLTIHQVDMEPAGMNPFSDYSYYRTLRRLFSRLRPDIVFLYTIKPNIYGALAAHSLGIPAVAMVAGLGYVFGGNTIRHKIGRLLYKYGLSKASNVLVLNSANRDVLCDRFVDRSKLILFEEGEGVDLTSYPFTDDDFHNIRFLMVSRVLYDKGYSEYVEAAEIIHKKYPDIEFGLLGPLDTVSPMGVPEEVIRKDDHAGIIRYLGSTDNVPLYLGREGVVAVLPSFYHEGLNRSLMEACCMGRPIITTDIAGCREVVRDGENGYLVKPRDSRGLADAMIAMIEATASERRAMGRKSFERAQFFDIRRVIAHYDRLLAQLV